MCAFREDLPQYGRLFGEGAQRKLESHQPSPEANQLLGRFVDQVLWGVDSEGVVAAGGKLCMGFFLEALRQVEIPLMQPLRPRHDGVAEPLSGMGGAGIATV